MTKLGLLFAGFAATLTIMLVAAPWRGDASEPATVQGTVDPAELARLNAELAALRGQVHRLDGAQSSASRQMRDLAAGQTEGIPSAQPEAAMTTAIDELAARQQAMERAAAQAELLDQTLGMESVDATWAPWAEGELQQNLGKLEGTSEIAVRCTSTLCRMELDFTDSESQERSMDHLADIAPWNGQGFFRMDKESLSLVLYLARDGEVLPRAG